MKCKSLVILLGVLIGLFSNYALASDDSPDAVGDAQTATRVVVIPLDLGGQKRFECSDCDGYFAPEPHDHHDWYYTKSELSASGGGGQVHWDNLTNRPSGLDDGDDVGLSNCSDCDGAFVNEGQTNSITSAMIMNGQVGSNDVNSTQVQLRVSGSCSAGNSIRVINQDGTVTCEPDDGGVGSCSDCDGRFVNATGDSMSKAFIGSTLLVTNPYIGPGMGGSIGVSGLATGTGVYGEALGIGVKGKSTSGGYGVQGLSTNGGYGVHGQVDAGGYAIYGVATGSGAVEAHYGGYFDGQGDYGCGIKAKAGPHGYAADLHGPVVIRSRSGVTLMEMGEGLDYAEGFDVSDHLKKEIKPGSVLVIDPDNPGKLTLSTLPYDTKVAGIIAGAKSLSSGVRLGVGQFDYDVALAGRVYCNADASREGVEPGDLLTTSDIPGHAMKATDYARAQGAILGKAMEKLDKGARGQILVLVTLQ